MYGSAIGARGAALEAFAGTAWRVVLDGPADVVTLGAVGEGDRAAAVGCVTTGPPVDSFITTRA